MNDRFDWVGLRRAIAGGAAIAGLGLVLGELARPSAAAPTTAQCLETDPRAADSRTTDRLTERTTGRKVEAQTERETEYWHTARRLLAERLYTIVAIREALLLPDPDAIARVDLDLYENLLKTRRFLRAFGADLGAGDRPGCGAAPAIRDDRLQVYCALVNTQPAIEALFEPLRVQQDAIADLPPSAFLPGTIAVGTPGEPDRLVTDDDRASTFDAATPLPGVTAKPPVARAPRPVVPPAYSPPPALLERLDAIVAPLLVARDVLPRAFAIALPESVDRPRTAAASLAAPADRPTNSPATETLAPRPNGYIPPNTIDLARNPTGNRILTDAPHTPLLSNSVSAAPMATVPGLPNAIATEFVPSLLLEIAGDRLEVVSLGFDFGAIAEIGTLDRDRDFETLTLNAALDRLDPELRPAFADYRPPDTFAALHADRQRVWMGKNDALGIAAGIATTQPAIADRVYLLRTVQYDLPEFVETGRALYPSERRNLDRALETPSFDATIAVQLLAATDDGGYLVRWRLLERFADPQIVDLYNYVNDRTGRTAR